MGAPRADRLDGPVRHPVEVLWDTWGVPHVRAGSARDAYVGLGYAMASERLWQLDYMRRLARGELAALMGASAVASDRAMRTLELGRTAERDAGELSEGVAEALDGLAAGINLFRERARRLPHELAPWRPADSIAIWKYRWWYNSGRLENVFMAEAARRLLPDELYRAFMAAELADETIVPDAGSSAASGADSGEGSNNWALGAAKSATGAPILCSDPHNPFAAPSQWFESQVTAPGLDVVGAIYQGTPGAYIGRTRHVAWGLTNHTAPARDVYVEQADPADPNRYRDGDAWRPFEVREEVIEVKGGAPVRFRLRRTVRGPVVNEGSGLIPELSHPHPDPLPEGEGTPPLSLRWVGHDRGPTFEAMLALNRAGSADDVLAALRHWTCPPLNFVYADTSGRFGYHVAGRVPRRRVATRGYRPANDPDHAWDGDLPFDELPRMADPPRGWVATANNPPWVSTNRHYLAMGAWADGYRMRRIRERIEAKDRLSLDEAAAIQGDVTSARARDLVPALLPLLEGERDPRARAARRHLEKWDYRFTTDSVGASVFAAFWEAWRAEIARARFPAELAPLVSGQCGALARRTLLGDDTGWFSDDPAGHVLRAFRLAIERLTQLAGPRVSGWRWGRLHTVAFVHPLGGRLNTGPYATSGGNVVRAAGHEVDGSFRVLGGATYRFAADLSREDAAESAQTLGQSARPGSRHYRDQTRLWLADRRKPLWMSEADVRANLEGATTIRPTPLRAPKA